MLRIAWPFALAALVAHVVLLAGRRAAARPWPGGVLVLAVTYVGGMLLRAASGRGLDPAFLVVAGLVLTTTILGWRLLLPMLARLRK